MKWTEIDACSWRAWDYLLPSDGQTYVVYCFGGKDFLLRISNVDGVSVRHVRCASLDEAKSVAAEDLHLTLEGKK